MTPVWVLLVVAGLGVAGTLGGVLVTGWMTSQREEAAARRDRRKATDEHRIKIYADVLRVIYSEEHDHAGTAEGLERLKPEMFMFSSSDVGEQYDQVAALYDEFAGDEEPPAKWPDRLTIAVRGLIQAIRRDFGVAD